MFQTLKRKQLLYKIDQSDCSSSSSSICFQPSSLFNPTNLDHVGNSYQSCASTAIGLQRNHTKDGTIRPPFSTSSSLPRMPCCNGSNCAAPSETGLYPKSVSPQSVLVTRLSKSVSGVSFRSPYDAFPADDLKTGFSVAQRSEAVQQ